MAEKDASWFSRWRENFLEKAQDCGGFSQPQTNNQGVDFAYQAMEAQAGVFRPASSLRNARDARYRSALTSQSSNTPSYTSSHASTATRKETKHPPNSQISQSQSQRLHSKHGPNRHGAMSTQPSRNSQLIPALGQISANTQDSLQVGYCSTTSDQTRPSCMSGGIEPEKAGHVADLPHPVQTRHYVGMSHEIDSFHFSNHPNFEGITEHDSDDSVQMSRGWENTFGKNQPSLRLPLPRSETSKDSYQNEVFIQSERPVSEQKHQTLERIFSKESYDTPQKKVQFAPAKNMYSKMVHPNALSFPSEAMAIGDRHMQAQYGENGLANGHADPQSTLEPRSGTDLDDRTGYHEQYSLGGSSMVMAERHVGRQGSLNFQNFPKGNDPGVYFNNSSIGSTSAEERQGYGRWLRQPIHPADRSRPVASIIAPEVRDLALSARRLFGHENAPPINPAERRGHVDFFRSTVNGASMPTPEAFSLPQNNPNVAEMRTFVDGKTRLKGDEVSTEDNFRSGHDQSRNNLHASKNYRESDLVGGDDANRQEPRAAFDKDWKFPRHSALKEKALENLTAEQVTPPSVSAGKRPFPPLFDPFPDGFEDDEWRQRKSDAKNYGQHFKMNSAGSGQCMASSDQKSRLGEAETRIPSEIIAPIKANYNLFPPIERSGARERDAQDRLFMRDNTPRTTDGQWNIPVEKGKHGRPDRDDFEGEISSGKLQISPDCVQNRVPSFEGVGHAKGPTQFDRPKRKRTPRTQTERAFSHDPEPEIIEPHVENVLTSDPNYRTTPVIQSGITPLVDAKGYLERRTAYSQLPESAHVSTDSFHQRNDKEDTSVMFVPPLHPEIGASSINSTAHATSWRNSFDIVIHIDRRTLHHAQHSGLAITVKLPTERFPRFDANHFERGESITSEAIKVSKSELYTSPGTAVNQEANLLVNGGNDDLNQPVNSPLYAEQLIAEGSRRKQVVGVEEGRILRQPGEAYNVDRETCQPGAARARHAKNDRKDLLACRAGDSDELSDDERGRVANGRLAAEKIRGKKMTPPLEETYFGRGPLKKPIDQTPNARSSLESVLAVVAAYDRPAVDPTRADRKLCAPFEETLDREERGPTPPCILEERSRAENKLPLDRTTNSGETSSQEQDQQHNTAPENTLRKEKSDTMIKSKLKKVKTHANLAGLYRSSSPTNVNNIVIASLTAEGNAPILSKSKSTLFDYLRGGTKEERATEKAEKELKAEIQTRVSAIQEEYRAQLKFTPINVIIGSAWLEVGELRAREEEKKQKMASAMGSLGVKPGDMKVDVIDVDAMEAELVNFERFYHTYRLYGSEQMGPMPEVRLITISTKDDRVDRSARPSGVPVIRIDPMADALGN